MSDLGKKIFDKLQIFEEFSQIAPVWEGKVCVIYHCLTHKSNVLHSNYLFITYYLLQLDTGLTIWKCSFILAQLYQSSYKRDNYLPMSFTLQSEIDLGQGINVYIMILIHFYINLGIAVIL